MRIKLDENLPARLVPLLNALGHDAHTVYQEGLSGRDDRTVCTPRRMKSDSWSRRTSTSPTPAATHPGTHHGLLLIRLRDPGREALTHRIRGLFENERVEARTGCIVVATDRKLRIRRSPAD